MDRLRIALCSVLLLGAAPAALAQPQVTEPPPAGSAPAPAPSTDEQAQRLADEAVEAYRSGKYDDAVRVFKQAYALRADPALLYNLAKSYERIGRRTEALEYYRRYLVAESTDPKLRARAEERVAALAQAAPGKQPAKAPPLAPPPQRPGRLFFFTGVGLAAAGVAGLVTGGALYSVAAQRYAAFSATQDELDKRALRDGVQPLSGGSIAAYTIGGVLLAGGGALVGLAVWKGFFRKDRAVGLAPLPGGGALVWQGAF